MLTFINKRGFLKLQSLAFLRTKILVKLTPICKSGRINVCLVVTLLFCITMCLLTQRDDNIYSINIIYYYLITRA